MHVHDTYYIRYMYMSMYMYMTHIHEWNRGVHPGSPHAQCMYMYMYLNAAVGIEE